MKSRRQRIVTFWLIAVGALVISVVACALISSNRINNFWNPFWKIQGNVISNDGRPVSSATIVAHCTIGYYPLGRMLENAPHREMHRVSVGKDGRFSFGARADTIRLEVRQPGMESKDLYLSVSRPGESVIRNPHAASNLVIVLSPADRKAQPAAAADGDPAAAEP